VHKLPISFIYHQIGKAYILNFTIISKFVNTLSALFYAVFDFINTKKFKKDIDN